MKTAFSILQTMTILPFQNVIINALDYAFQIGGYDSRELYFEQLTPLVILSTTAEETGKSIEQVEDEVNDSMQTSEIAQTDAEINPDSVIPAARESFSITEFNSKNYEIFDKTN
jgi:hypothetical protein